MAAASELVAELPDEQVPPMDPAEGIKSLLDVLVPPEELLIVDIFGNEYTVSAVCSARVQIKVLRKLDKLRELSLVQEVVGEMDFNANGIQGIIDALMRVSAEDEVVELLAGAFEIAHTLPYAKAKKSAKSNKVTFQDAADLFPVEEIIGAVVPLFIRLARRGATAIGAVSRATTTVNRPQMT